MPSSKVILESLTTIANEWRMLAIVWHIGLGAGVVAVIAGWRPSNRVVAYVFVTPLISVSAAAWVWGNPFNGAMFALLAALLVGIASRMSNHPVHIARARLVAPAAMLLVFGWTYPHFLERNPWTAYLYAAPIGLLPCPTVAMVIGATVILSFLDSTPWTATIAIAGLVYGAIGVFGLGVHLDYGLLTGALLALGALTHRVPFGTVWSTSTSVSRNEPSPLGKTRNRCGEFRRPLENDVLHPGSHAQDRLQ